jgi:PAS domain S-box-containing protein
MAVGDLNSMEDPRPARPASGFPSHVPPSVLVDTITRNTNDAIVAVSFNRTILSWNRGAERLLGYTAGEVVGKSFDPLVPEIEISRVAGAIQRLRNGEPPTQYEAVRIAKGGARVDVLASMSLLSVPEGEAFGVLAIIRDISAQKATERALALRLRQQAGLAWLGQQALAEMDLDALLDEALALVKRTLEVDLVKIQELEPGGQELLLRAGLGWQPGAVGQARVNAGVDSQAGYTLMARRPVVVEDLSRETRFQTPPLLIEHDVVSGLTAVIEGAGIGQPYGVIGVHSREPRVFTQDDINFLQTVATVLAAGFRQFQAAMDREARRQAEATLQEIQVSAQQRAVLLDAANRVALDILSSRMGVEALRHIAEAARVLAGARYAALGVARVGGRGLEQFITTGLTAEEQARIGDLPRGAGVLGLLLEQKHPLRIDDLCKHPSSVGFPPNHPPMSSFLGVPIRRGEVTVGSLYLTNKQDGEAFTEADEAAVNALAAYAAVAIHNLQMLSRQRDLTRSLLTAQEEERRSVAYDLHDGLTQYVMAAYAHLEAFKRARAGGDESKATRQVERGMAYLQEAVVESRRMINNLRLLVLDDLGLPGALQQLLREEAERAGWEAAELDENTGEERFEVTLETTVYRIAQEALTNARRHAHTRWVHIELRKEVVGHNVCLRLEVRDWGQGFVAAERLGTSGHFGLQGVVERVHLLDGTYELRTSPGEGTTISVTFPL